MCFKKCNLYQGIESTVDWKPRLQNYKSHIKKKLWSCSIVNHFIDACSDTDDPWKNIRFIIIDQLNNTNSVSPDEIDDLLLQKERFWISTLVTIHKDLIAQMIGIKSDVQNALSKDRTYDN